MRLRVLSKVHQDKLQSNLASLSDPIYKFQEHRNSCNYKYKALRRKEFTKLTVFFDRVMRLASNVSFTSLTLVIRLRKLSPSNKMG